MGFSFEPIDKRTDKSYVVHLFQFPSNGIFLWTNYEDSTVLVPARFFQFPSNGIFLW